MYSRIHGKGESFCESSKGKGSQIILIASNVKCTGCWEQDSLCRGSPTQPNGMNDGTGRDVLILRG
jgi:hypothetical protein